MYWVGGGGHWKYVRYWVIVGVYCVVVGGDWIDVRYWVIVGGIGWVWVDTG